MAVEYLIMPSRASRDYDVLAQACFWAGIEVLRLDPGGEGRIPKACAEGNTAIRGGSTFCRNVAAALGGEALEPADDFLPSLPRVYTNREITLTSLAAARSIHEPKFIKPVNDKYFDAAVFASGADLPKTTVGDNIQVLVSDPVRWRCEYRLFVLDRAIKASSPYGLADGQSPSEAEHEAALAFGRTLLNDPDAMLPRAVVLDVGFIEDAGWSVVEANTVTMSGLYDCEPLAVIDVLVHGITAQT